MPPFLLRLLADPRHIAIAALGITCCVLWARLAWVDHDRDAAVERAAHHQQRADSLAHKVVQADMAVREASAINQRQQAALDTQSRAVAALRAEAERQEQRATAAQAEALRAAEVSREADRVRRARQDLPSAEEMTTVLAESLEGL